MRRLVITVTALALVLTACAGEDDPEVGSAAPEDTEVEDADEPDDGSGDDADSEGSPDGGDAGTDDADAEDADAEDATDEGATDEDAADAEPASVPDPAELEDPCADQQGREDEAFLELVAPVDDQTASDELEIVGCANVPEGTVQYRLLDGDGATLDEDFTTADCGGPCLGEFRETVPLDSASGEPVVDVQVFWEDLSDGSERGLTERIVVLE